MLTDFARCCFFLSFYRVSIFNAFISIICLSFSCFIVNYKREVPQLIILYHLHNSNVKFSTYRNSTASRSGGVFICPYFI